MRARFLLAILLISLAAPARAVDDVAAAQGVIRSQVEAFSRDDAAAAYSHAAPAIQEIFPQADIFMSMVRSLYAPVYRHKSFDFGEARVSDGTIAQRVHIVDADGIPWEALYTLELQPDGSVKITGCVLLRAGQGCLVKGCRRRSLHGFGVIRRFVAGFGILPSRIVGFARQAAPLAASSAPRFNISASLVASCL
jgi:Domain of unknown function (DUF4864)